MVFYLRGKRVVGIVMWNVFNRMPIAHGVRPSEEPRGPDASPNREQPAVG